MHDGAHRGAFRRTLLRLPASPTAAYTRINTRLPEVSRNRDARQMKLAPIAIAITVLAGAVALLATSPTQAVSAPVQVASAH